MYKVTSEIYEETNVKSVVNSKGRVISYFKFKFLGKKGFSNILDEDGDMIVERKNGIIEIEHSISTNIELVGLQVWRGSLLLCDFIFHNCDRFAEKTILELAAGVGLATIASAMFAKKVVCTDIDKGDILKLIASNIERNKHFVEDKTKVIEFNFTAENFTEMQNEAIMASDFIFVADVIYDDEITNSFVSVIDRIFEMCPNKEIYMALEKRFVFTLEDMDAVAPSFEHFVRLIGGRKWFYVNIEIDFPQYFMYKRCNNLILLLLKTK